MEYKYKVALNDIMQTNYLKMEGSIQSSYLCLSSLPLNSL